ncbi:sensor histidine kinase [Cohaesibacter gelatinilyticus]|uniref:histidine kinase n=1 Tax=Cohaesibacter gelatinilyticus TaxID=372072 RepID=A0A285NEK9_9HYPH|nr:sensor histidine kinase [Cohaesibacter gelatinilyticus]SNZ07397.1 two-component system, OmpR family, sensor histidine kinase TctE [Cohaesibacter gelatinilyticus]
MNEQPTPYSLRRRLLLWLLIPLGLIALLALVDSYFNARQTANDAADRVLAGSVQAISERVFVNDSGQLEVDIPYVALDMLTSAAQDRVFYRIDGPDNEFVTGYRQLPVTLQKPQSLATRDAIQFDDTRYKRDKIRLAVMYTAASSGLRSIPFRVAVAETMIARQRLTQEILIRSALRQAVLVLSAAIIVWFAVTRGLRPLIKLEAAIGRRSPDDLRPILHHVPHEVSGLVLRINDFMARLSSSIHALKNFTGNASHQIRTPLAIIRTQITLAQRADQMEDAKHALITCNHAISDAERTLSQLMLLARLDHSARDDIQRSEINLSQIAKTVTTSFVPPAHEAGFDLGFEGEEDLICNGDEILISELLKNLIDNAIKHAKGGSEITVRVQSVKRDKQDYARLEVQDDGVGIPHEIANQMERFNHYVNLSEGNGLGLAIANEIANLFKAKLAIQPIDAGEGGLIRLDLERSS